MIMNKLAAGITATAIAATAFSAPAKADEDINALIALLAGGLIINEIVKDKKEDKRVAKDPVRKRDESITHRHYDGTWYTHPTREHARRYHDRYDRRYDRKPDRVGRGPNPEVYFPIQDRLQKLPMPQSCGVKVYRPSAKPLRAYSKSCLKKSGYKISKKGTVSNKRYPRLTRRPVLVR